MNNCRKEYYKELILSSTEYEVEPYTFTRTNVCTYNGWIGIVHNGFLYMITNREFSRKLSKWDKKFVDYLKSDDDIRSHLDNLKRINAL